MNLEFDAMAPIYLVSCVSKKREHKSAAKDLYISDWFIKARKVVEATGCKWFILSAAHGLLKPEQIIEPYNHTLSRMVISERREWGERTSLQLLNTVSQMEQVIFFAGQRYREFLLPQLAQHNIKTVVPMAGLSIGRQLRWLKQSASETHSSREKI
ncbi:DUF6884 domain-containing protein [Undibacterium sp. SXout7W]|uniref:DUF6884 domain-containing protein n=1 Tax=Undibacterium sp. SXout7W TaxID=3413049 RepID=UPI003BF3086A